MKNQYSIIASLIVFSVFVMKTSVAKDGDKKVASESPAHEMAGEGNNLLKKGQFNAAMVVWQKVLDGDKANANANFKMGMCYFNSIDQQPKAIPFLKKSTTSLTDKYDFFDADAKAAPNDALYFLGQSYLTNNQPDSALIMFFQYDDKYNGNPPIPTDKAIRNCINAKNAVKSPRDVTMKNPGKNVNSQYAETNPVLTIDNSVMFFASRRQNKDNTKKVSDVNGKFDEDIYFTLKDNTGKWETAIPFKWNTLSDEAPLCLSSDGLTLYLRKDVKGQTDVFQSHYIDKVWSEPKPVSEINSSANETGVSVSADGKYLYFCSDREGGTGRYDIYQCAKNGDKWGKPKNLGATINTSSSEISPFINPNGKTLFFSSNGYADGMGGFDIFYSEMKDDGSWTTPQTMGFPINTTRDDINYYIIGGGTRYYSTIREESDSYDIFKIEGGGFSMENIDATGQVVTLTKEMSVSDVVEVNKTVEKEVDVVETVETTVEVIKEVEKVDVEKEKMKMDSMLTLARKEVAADKTKEEADKAKAELEKVKAEEAIKTAEATKAAADAESKKADAQKAIADADKAKSDAIKATADATKAKADAVIAAAQKAKDDLAKAKIDADTKKSEAAIAQANAAKAKSEADKAKSEELKVKDEDDKIQFAAEKAKMEGANLQLKNQLAENEKPKYEAAKAQAEAAKAKAENDKLKLTESIASAQKAKDEAAKAKLESDATKATAAADAAKANAEAKKAEAEKLKSQADMANATKAQADATKATAAADAAKAMAEAKKADADKLKAQADIANATKAKADADKVTAAAETMKAAADSKKADVDKLKAQADIANSTKAKADADKAAALATKSVADADKAKADAEAKKAQADIAAAEKAKADADKAASQAEKAKADAEAKKAQLEILKLQPPKPKPAAPKATDKKTK